MQPINYSIDVKSPFEEATKGYQNAFAQSTDQMKLGLALQQQQQQTLANQQMQTDLMALSKNPNPTAQDYASVMTKYPQMAENIQRSWSVLNPEQQKNRLSEISQVDAALHSGNNQVAIDLLKKQAEAYRNSGNEQEAVHSENLINQIQTNPDGAKLGTASALAVVLGPEKYAENLAAVRKTPSEVEKSQAEAQQKTAEAANTPDKLALDNAKTSEDIQTKRLDRKVNILNAQINAADSETKRGQLQAELDKIQLERDKFVGKPGDIQSQAQDRLDTINNSLDTINKILNHPAAQNGITGTGSFYGASTGILPGSDRRDLNNLVDTVKSQQFITALQNLKSNGKGTGLGNLSDAEGKRLETAIATLDPNSKSFVENVKTIKNTLDRVQQKIVAEGNLPTKNQGLGNTFVMNHPKLGVVNDAFINKMLATHPGSTREQVIQYLQQSGGQ